MKNLLVGFLVQVLSNFLVVGEANINQAALYFLTVTL
jgi:hypothetical protein